MFRIFKLWINVSDLLTGEALKLVELEKKYKMQSEQLYQSMWNSKLLNWPKFIHGGIGDINTKQFLELAQEKAELDQAQERLVELKSEEETLPPLLARLQDELQQEQKVLDRKRKGRWIAHLELYIWRMAI